MAIAPVLRETPLVLDTDVFNDWRFQKQHAKQAIKDYISNHKAPPAMTSMTVFEVLYGFEKRAAESGGLDERTRRDRDKVEQLIQYCGVLSFDQTAAAIAAYVFPRLSQRERNKHWGDTFTAATVLAHGHGVATRNREDFELIANHLPPSHPLLRLAVWRH